MTTQAFEPSKTNGLHPSIMKGAIAMNADDFKSEKAPANSIHAALEADERNAQLERAEAWRIEMMEHFKNSGDADESQERIRWLQGLEGDDLTRAHRFYLAAKGHAIMDAAENQDHPTNEESRPPQPDPHISWHAELEILRQQCREGGLSGDESEALMDTIIGLEKAIMKTPARSPEALRLQICAAVREVEEVMEGEDSETVENLAHRLVIDAAKKLLASPAFQTQQELHVTWYAELEALREKQEQLFSLAKAIEVRHPEVKWRRNSEAWEEKERLREQTGYKAIHEEADTLSEKIVQLENLIMETSVKTLEGARCQTKTALRLAKNEFQGRDLHENSETFSVKCLMEAARGFLTLTPETAGEQE
jgi:hypothetical protein